MPRRPIIKRVPRNTLKAVEHRSRWRWVLSIVAAVAVIWVILPTSPERLRNRAAAAERAQDWPTAFDAWHSLNQTTSVRASTCLSEAKAALAANLSSKAEQALRRAIALEPSSPDAWNRLLELLRVEDRTLDALRDGREALRQIASPADRVELLRRLTLAVLAELPDEVARPLLDRWIHADPDDLDALVAKFGKVAAMPRPDDPDRALRIRLLQEKLTQHPEHARVREALISALADAGEPDRGRALLESWPEPRDARHDRLKGRWALDYDLDRPTAVAAFRRALKAFPHDWKTHYGLARALDDPSAAAQSAANVAKLRETLDPAILGPLLSRSFAHLNEKRARLDLAELCEKVGLNELAEAWRAQAEADGERNLSIPLAPQVRGNR